MDKQSMNSLTEDKKKEEYIKKLEKENQLLKEENKNIKEIGYVDRTKINLEEDIKTKILEENNFPNKILGCRVKFGYDWDYDSCIYVTVTIENDHIEKAKRKYNISDERFVSREEKRIKTHSMVYDLVSRMIDRQIFIYVELSP